MSNKITHFLVLEGQEKLLKKIEVNTISLYMLKNILEQMVLEAYTASF